MKTIILACVLALSGCGLPEPLTGAVGVGATIGSVAVIQRTPVDAVYSILSGRDCSAVRWDEGKSYCRATKPKPAAPPFCTRSLGVVDCWADPSTLPGHPHGVADGPTVLTARQEADRVRGWPW